MAFDITKILNATTNAQAANTEIEDFTPIRLDYEEIVITKHNKYSMDELEEMAAGIEMAGGLQQPLVLGRVNGEYWLAGGHRRHGGVDILVKGGAEQYRVVNCVYKDMTETEFRLHLLIGNAFNRHYTDYDKMIEAEEWKAVLKQAKKEGSFLPDKGTRTREYIARIMGTSAAVVGDWNRINKNATDEIKEQFKEGNIGVTAAAAASQLSEDEQNEIAAAAAAGEDIKATEIQKIVDEKKAQAAAGDESDGSDDEKKEKRSITEQKTAQMSDTDTTEEEKANARRLHALKMLEKYYIYMSDEEVGILERMLEDCKRRKREYGIEDVGSTI